MLNRLEKSIQEASRIRRSSTKLQEKAFMQTLGIVESDSSDLCSGNEDDSSNLSHYDTPFESSCTIDFHCHIVGFLSCCMNRSSNGLS